MKECRYLKGRYCVVKAKTLAVGKDGKVPECEACQPGKEKSK